MTKNKVHLQHRNTTRQGLAMCQSDLFGMAHTKEVVSDKGFQELLGETPSRCCKVCVKESCDYRVFDTVEKTYLPSSFRHGVRAASQKKDMALDGGMYANRPHTVLEVHEFCLGKFTREMAGE